MARALGFPIVVLQIPIRTIWNKTEQNAGCSAGPGIACLGEMGRTDWIEGVVK
ncbi:hypothetical protein GGTG_08489 [Gaeumannomyces tritici R3-111a-1]|uniref:Uncharacterized protein n=1 Tax=Gaeumannomyces tritici (strain R3-111a-1) TaxID=644352 RepID=J3P4Q2_GAET3|nr:hypothetical protein GGTG_08489 [Gaeumannomyces tritici R3-111a-1]EJT74649.1 hypothetical protein GGTG_08489 [Gaeumannomyces tritici R3-111a-1]